MELFFFHFLEDSSRRARHLFAALSRDPDLFASLVALRYTAEPPTRRGAPSDEVELSPVAPEPEPGDIDRRQRRAKAAYMILSGWDGIPGADLAAADREKELLSWALAALQRTAEQGRKTMGEQEVARVLARAPGALEDGVWPSRAARELLESGRHSAFEDGLFTAKINLRGGTSRAIGEGGEQERALATGFRTDARKLRIQWPRTSALLDKLAERYDREGETEDAEALSDRRRWGPPEDHTERDVAAGPGPQESIAFDRIEAPLRALLRAEAEETARRSELHAALRETPEYRAQVIRMQKCVVAFAQTLRMAMLVATRAPEFVDNSFFLRNVDDFVSSASMAAFAFGEGGLNAGRRELRFLLELSVQAAYIDEASRKADFATKIEVFARRKKPNSVDHVKDLPLTMLGDARDRFVRHLMKSWARASEYAHPTRHQLEKKLELRARGVSPGFETADELRVCIDALFHACAAGIVLGFHIIGPSFAGDMLVDGLDSVDTWPFHTSPFIAKIDAEFDYKHERKERLTEIVSRRAARVRDDVLE